MSDNGEDQSGKERPDRSGGGSGPGRAETQSPYAFNFYLLSLLTPGGSIPQAGCVCRGVPDPSTEAEPCVYRQIQAMRVRIHGTTMDTSPSKLCPAPTAILPAGLQVQA